MKRFLPPRPFLDTILTRVALVWLALHMFSAGFAAMSGGSFSEGLAVGPAGIIWIWGVVLIALRLDLERRSESVFLANLGHSVTRISFLALLECSVLEAGLGLLV